MKLRTAQGSSKKLSNFVNRPMYGVESCDTLTSRYYFCTCLRKWGYEKREIMIHGNVKLKYNIFFSFLITPK